MNSDNTALMHSYIQKINEELRKFTEDKPPLYDAVFQAMEYSLTAGGKRLRPMLMLEFYRVCGGMSADSYLDIACSVELVHTYSLIHDDLPCMDDDNFRRGRPSCHVAFPENIALLAGDALNTLAFEVISNAAIEERIPAQTAVMLISVLSKAAGANGMIGGQVIDLKSENKKINIDVLDKLQEYKTGALIEAACVMGVILAGDYEKIPDAVRYANAMGKAFQIVDDILDVTGTFEQLGKPIGSDSEQNKNTYVSVCGLDEAKAISKKLTAQALESLQAFDNNEFLCELTEELLERKR